jgi:hypothetical protein
MDAATSYDVPTCGSMSVHHEKDTHRENGVKHGRMYHASRHQQHEPHTILLNDRVFHAWKLDAIVARDQQQSKLWSVKIHTVRQDDERLDNVDATPSTGSNPFETSLAETATCKTKPEPCHVSGMDDHKTKNEDVHAFVERRGGSSFVADDDNVTIVQRPMTSHLESRIDRRRTAAAIFIDMTACSSSSSLSPPGQNLVKSAISRTNCDDHDRMEEEPRSQTSHESQMSLYGRRTDCVHDEDDDNDEEEKRLDRQEKENNTNDIDTAVRLVSHDSHHPRATAHVLQAPRPKQNLDHGDLSSTLVTPLASILNLSAIEKGAHVIQWLEEILIHSSSSTLTATNAVDKSSSAAVVGLFDQDLSTTTTFVHEKHTMHDKAPTHNNRRYVTPHENTWRENHTDTQVVYPDTCVVPTAPQWDDLETVALHDGGATRHPDKHGHHHPENRTTPEAAPTVAETSMLVAHHSDKDAAYPEKPTTPRDEKNALVSSPAVNVRATWSATSPQATVPSGRVRMNDLYPDKATVMNPDLPDKARTTFPESDPPEGPRVGTPPTVFAPTRASEQAAAAGPMAKEEDNDNDDDDDIICAVCCGGESFEDDLILLCDGCNVGVHQHCYGVNVVQETQWFCDACLARHESQRCDKRKNGFKPAHDNQVSRPSSFSSSSSSSSSLHDPNVIRCVLCPMVRGALKRSQCGQWVHLQCFLWYTSRVDNTVVLYVCVCVPLGSLNCKCTCFPFTTVVTNIEKRQALALP